MELGTQRIEDEANHHWRRFEHSFIHLKSVGPLVNWPFRLDLWIELHSEAANLDRNKFAGDKAHLMIDGCIIYLRDGVNHDGKDA